MDITDFIKTSDIIYNNPLDLNDTNITIINNKIGIGTDNIEDEYILKVEGDVDIDGKIYADNNEWDLNNTSSNNIIYKVFDKNDVNFEIPDNINYIKAHLFGAGGSSLISDTNIIDGEQGEYNYVYIPLIENDRNIYFNIGEKGENGGNGNFTTITYNNEMKLKVFGGNGYNTIINKNRYVYNIANNNLLVKTDISFSVDNNGINNKITFEFPEDIVAEPLLDHNDEYIYVYHSNLYKIKTENLEQQWKYPLSNIVNYRGIIDNNDEYLYIGDIDGNIYKFNIKNNSLENEYKLDFGISTSLVLDNHNTYLYCGLSYELENTDEYSNIFCKLDTDRFFNNLFLKGDEINTEIFFKKIEEDSIILDNDIIYFCTRQHLFKLNIKDLNIKKIFTDSDNGSISSFPFINNEYIYLFIRHDVIGNKLIKINKYEFTDNSNIVEFSGYLDGNTEYILNNVDNVYLNLYIHNNETIKSINYNDMTLKWSCNINNITNYPILTKDNNYIYIATSDGNQYLLNSKNGEIINHYKDYLNINNNIYNTKYSNYVTLNRFINNIPITYNIDSIVPSDIRSYLKNDKEFGYKDNDSLIILELYLNYDIIKNNKKMVIKNDILTKNLVVLDEKININQDDILININEILERDNKYLPSHHIHSLNYNIDQVQTSSLNEYESGGNIYIYYEITENKNIELINFYSDILIVGGGGGRGNGIIHGAGGGGEVFFIEDYYFNGNYSFIVGNSGNKGTKGEDSIIKNNLDVEIFKSYGGNSGSSTYDYFPTNINIKLSLTNDSKLYFENFTNDIFIAKGGVNGSIDSSGRAILVGTEKNIILTNNNNVECVDIKGNRVEDYQMGKDHNNEYTVIRTYLSKPTHYLSISQSLNIDIYDGKYGYGQGSYLDGTFNDYTNNGIIFYRFNGGTWNNIKNSLYSEPILDAIFHNPNEETKEINVPSFTHTMEFYLIGSGGSQVSQNIMGKIYYSAGSSGGIIYVKYESKYYGKEDFTLGTNYGSGGGATGRLNNVYNNDIPNLNDVVNSKGISYNNVGNIYMNDGGKNINNTTGGAGGGAFSIGKDNGEGGDGYIYNYNYKDIIAGTGGYATNFLQDTTNYYGKGSDIGTNNATNGIIILISKKDANNSNLEVLLSEGTHIENSFTGKHFVSIENEEFHQGYIVSTTGKYQDIDSSYHPDSINRNIDISQALPIVEYSKKEKDKKCFGVVNYIEKKDDKFRDNGYNFFYNSIKRDGDERLIVNSIGEGSIWVSNYNGPLENGDFITTSPIPGIGMKQDEDYITNYTVGKITMDCDFNPKKIEVKRSLELYRNGILNNTLDKNENIIYENTGIIEDEYKIENIDINGNIREDGEYKIAFVGCTYHCG
jgi:hypothetical protein